jgi:hypothetical protein
MDNDVKTLEDSSPYKSRKEAWKRSSLMALGRNQPCIIVNIQPPEL